jgi:hypothetical protein
MLLLLFNDLFHELLGIGAGVLEKFCVKGNTVILELEGDFKPLPGSFDRFGKVLTGIWFPKDM